MADNLQINIGGNADGAMQAANEMGRSFAQNAGEMQKHLANLNKALGDFQQRSGKNFTRFSLKDLDDESLQAYAVAVTGCQYKIIDLENALRSLGTRTKANGQEFDKLTKELVDAERAYSKVQAEIVKFIGKADAAAAATDKLSKNTEKSTNFFKQIGLTTALYGFARVTNELYKAAEAAEKFQEAAGGFTNIQAPPGVKYLAENRETLALWRDIVEGGAMGGAAGSIGGPWGTAAGIVLGAATNTIAGYQERNMTAAAEAAQINAQRMERIQDKKLLKEYDLEKNAAEEYLNSKFAQATTPMEREAIIDEAIAMFKNFGPDKLLPIIDYIKAHLESLDVQRQNAKYNLNTEEGREASNNLEKHQQEWESKLAKYESLLDDYYKFVDKAEKAADEKNKADAKAAEELAKQKEKAEKEAAAKALKAKKDALNEEYKDLKDKKAKEQQLRRDTEKEMSDIVSQRNDKISDITSTRDSISTNFSKVGGSVGPQFAALSKVLENEQASLKNYQDTMKKNIQTITSVVKDIDNEIKANREKLAALG